MPLVVNNIELDEKSDSIIVNNIAVQKIVVNDTEIVWQRKYTPHKPINFDASNGLYGEVLCTWDSASDVDWYQLFADGVAVTPDEVGITSPYSYITLGVALYKIRAWNEHGYTDSDPDMGISLDAGAGNVVIDYSSVSGANPETVIAVADGTWTFTPPAGIIEIELCMIGGGGSGASQGGDLTFAIYSGGGWAGDIVQTYIEVTPLVPIPLLIAKGGVAQSTSGDWLVGDSGWWSEFAELYALGGLGGDYGSSSDYDDYAGNGAERRTCLGAGNDGLQDFYDYLFGYYAMGGQSSGAGNGGNGDMADNWRGTKVVGQGGNGGVGCGGGGCQCFHGTSTSGSGGNGRITISWKSADK